MSINHRIPRIVGIWLVIGIVMVFFQVVIGGITRLTDSGLSITEWDVIKGTIPPLNQVQWEEAFTKYKEHTLQYEAIHKDMTLKEFKYIYFWEYFHRLWARSMGFVFLIPFLIFWRKKWLPSALMKDLGLVVGLAALAAVFGWIMVSSGVDTSTHVWVNAYRLTIHLSIAISLLSVLWWATLRTIQPVNFESHNKRLRKMAWRITGVIILQLVFGGLMSGMKAGSVAPHFPHMGVDQDGSWIWFSEVLSDWSQWKWSNLVAYNNQFAPALVQVVHRTTAYLLCILIPVFSFKIFKLDASPILKRSNYFLLLMLIVQVSLGIITVINSTNPDLLPVFGVLHQAGGMLLLLAMLLVNYQFGKGGYRISKNG